MRRLFMLAPLFASLARVFPAHAQGPNARGALPPSLRETAAKLLATLIQAARENAIASGVRPVPATIQRALLGFFPDAILRKIRYSAGQAEAITLPGLALTYGHIDAVTLGDVILFRDERAALADAKLWAHELTHVMQYERWGTEGFATRYLEDFTSLEKEARDNAARFVSWRQHA